MNARELTDGWDVCIVHDPQPAALHTLVPEKARELGLALPHRPLDAEPGDDRAAAAVHRAATRSRSSTCSDYVPDRDGRQRATSSRRRSTRSRRRTWRCRPRTRSYVCNQFGIDVDRPLICQVSRFDPWKDPLGVIDAYRIVKEQMPDVQLALVGSMATDDPEGWDFFNATIAHADGDPDIHILNNFNNVGAIEVNAFQSHSDVLMQKSTREGFGLTVSARRIWKGGRSSAATSAASRCRWTTGVSGYLVDSVERCARSARSTSSRPRAGQGARAAREGARARALPDAALPARLPEDLPQDAGALMTPKLARPLVLVSNRGPVTSQDDGVGQARHRRPRHGAHRPRVAPRRRLDRVGADRRRQRRARKPGGEPFVVHTPEGGEYHVRLVVSDDRGLRPLLQRLREPDAVVHPALPLGPVQRAGHPPRTRSRRSSTATTSSTRTSPRRSSRRSRACDEPVVMVHDYHLYTLPGLVRRARPDVFLHHFVHIPWTQPDAWRVLPHGIREEIYEGLLANDIIGFHTRSYRRNFLQCCRDLMDLDVDFDAGVVHVDGREVWVRAYPLPIDCEATQQVAAPDARAGVRGASCCAGGATT